MVARKKYPRSLCSPYILYVQIHKNVIEIINSFKISDDFLEIIYSFEINEFLFWNHNSFEISENFFTNKKLMIY